MVHVSWRMDNKDGLTATKNNIVRYNVVLSILYFSDEINQNFNQNIYTCNWTGFIQGALGNKYFIFHVSLLLLIVIK